MVRSHLRIGLMLGAVVAPLVFAAPPTPQPGPVAAPPMSPNAGYPAPGRPFHPAAGSLPTEPSGGPKSNSCDTYARTFSGSIDPTNPAYEEAFNNCMRGN